MSSVFHESYGRGRSGRRSLSVEPESRESRAHVSRIDTQAAASPMQKQKPPTLVLAEVLVSLVLVLVVPRITVVLLASVVLDCVVELDSVVLLTVVELVSDVLVLVVLLVTVVPLFDVLLVADVLVRVVLRA